MKYKKFEKQIMKNKGFVPEAMNRITSHDGDNTVSDPMNEQINGEWIVNPVAMMNGKVFVVCPFCGQIHSHGVGDGSYSGGRTTDCKGGSGAYFIKPITA